MSAASAEDVLAFWSDAGPEKWFEADPAFDAEVRDALLPLHEEAARGVLDGWAATAPGALALVLLLDQVPRNVFRGTAAAFASDPKALAVAEAAIARGLDALSELGPYAGLASFFYLPLMHAEDPARQARCVDLFQRLGDENKLKHALIHQDVIARFGRFPHRNAALGRAMTEAEQAFLDGGGFRA